MQCSRKTHIFIKVNTYPLGRWASGRQYTHLADYGILIKKNALTFVSLITESQRQNKLSRVLASSVRVVHQAIIIASRWWFLSHHPKTVRKYTAQDSASCLPAAAFDALQPLATEGG